MKIKFKHAVFIWIALAFSVVAKDIVTENPRLLASAATDAPVQNEFPFVVDVSPAHANVMIMNIGPKYTKGMILPKGRYDVKVSLKGYYTQRGWIDHTDNSIYRITLERRN
ncbi:hypothetical protein [Marinomonas ostreistagni]|uniref:hypothetical protein n=1 Tax=Marinomonas ostreistagni TaxID=359209 RepID=UPI001950E8D0|nr:hypothetical protein [Marinomonas ostreistagni]MBM6551822.1 hypothetical protein [Marinomonas ostreistagni]